MAQNRVLIDNGALARGAGLIHPGKLQASLRAIVALIPHSADKLAQLDG